MDTEYVVVEPIRLSSLAAKVEIDPFVFIWFFRGFNSVKGWELTIGENFNSSYTGLEHAEELLRLGFIEEKVEDPIVEVGDYLSGDGSIYRMIKLDEDDYGLFNDTHSEVCAWSFPVINKTCSISELVGKEHLTKFKKVNVKITVEED